MDRRSWLWRRKSSEKSPTDHTSASLSERFSDDQTSNHINIQSTSKAAAADESVSNEALVNIRAKEDLVKQHAKVAEEAVSGWEMAEKEVTVLKKQNEALAHTNLILEERVGHLDGALKECLRQHRQEEDKLQNSLQNANAKLEAAEKDKSILRLELEIRSRDRDLSHQAATKQHLDNLKKVAELEAECLQLKARRATDDSRGFPSVDIYLMDDFLEMEKLASLPESASRDEVEATINRAAELEDTLTKITAEKVRLEIQLKASDDRLEVELRDLKIQLALANEATANARKEVERTKAETRNIAKLLDEADENMEKIQQQLKETNQAKEDANAGRTESEARLKLMEKSISALEIEVEKEKNVSRKAVTKCDILEAEISRIKSFEFRIDQDKELAVAATKFAECQNTIASLGRQLKSLATLDDFLLDSERRQVTLS